VGSSSKGAYYENVMSLTPEEELKVANIIAVTAGATLPEPSHTSVASLSPEQELAIANILHSNPETGEQFDTERELRKFSLGALGLGPIYYFRSKDWLFFWISFPSVLFLWTAVFLIPLAFLARRRAWERSEERDFGRFLRAQRRWDVSGLFGGILGMLFLLISLNWVSHSFESSFGTSDPSQLLKQAQQLQSDNAN
jgi:hypothetical protein